MRLQWSGSGKKTPESRCCRAGHSRFHYRWWSLLNNVQAGTVCPRGRNTCAGAAKRTGGLAQNRKDGFKLHRYFRDEHNRCLARDRQQTPYTMESHEMGCKILEFVCDAYRASWVVQVTKCFRTWCGTLARTSAPNSSGGSGLVIWESIQIKPLAPALANFFFWIAVVALGSHPLSNCAMAVTFGKTYSKYIDDKQCLMSKWIVRYLNSFNDYLSLLSKVRNSDVASFDRFPNFASILWIFVLSCVNFVLTILNEVIGLSSLMSPSV